MTADPPTPSVGPTRRRRAGSTVTVALAVTGLVAASCTAAADDSVSTTVPGVVTESYGFEISSAAGSGVVIPDGEPQDAVDGIPVIEIPDEPPPDEPLPDGVEPGPTDPDIEAGPTDPDIEAGPTDPNLETGWLARINQWRAESGVTPARDATSLADGIDQHLAYMINTPLELQAASDHVQNPASAWATTAGARAARTSNIWTNVAPLQQATAIDGWMYAPFHAMFVLRPEIDSFHFADVYAPDTAQRQPYGAMLGLGRWNSRNRQTATIRFPGPGSTIEASAYGGEAPDPLDSCPGLDNATVDTGLPIFVMPTYDIGRGSTFALVHPDGRVEQLCVVDRFNSDAVARQPFQVAVGMPAAPLGPGTYEARFQAPGRDAEVWRFDIAPTPAASVLVEVRDPASGRWTTSTSSLPTFTAGQRVDVRVQIVSTRPTPISAETVRIGDQQLTIDLRPAHYLPVEATITVPEVPSPRYEIPVTFSSLRAFSSGVAIPVQPTFETDDAVVGQVERVPPGYWVLERDGDLYGYGDGRPGTAPALEGSIDITAAGDRLWILNEAGFVEPRNGAGHFGDPGLGGLVAGERHVAIAATRGGDGYVVATNLGRVTTFGATTHHGDLFGENVTNVIDVVLTADASGYWLLDDGGGVAAFGSAPFHGSIPALQEPGGPLAGVELACPMGGLVPTPSGRGYWMVACDGGVFAFGDAGFVGSLPGVIGRAPDEPVVGMVPHGNGYLMVATDGGVFTFSNLPFAGSPRSTLGGARTDTPTVSIASVG